MSREKEEHFFVGEDYQNKLDTYDEYEESDDDFLNEAIKKLAFFVSFWYMGRATSEEEFGAVEELYNSQNKEEEERRPKKPIKPLKRLMLRSLKKKINLKENLK